MKKNNRIFEEARGTVLFEYLTGRIDEERYMELNLRIEKKEQLYNNT